MLRRLLATALLTILAILPAGAVHAQSSRQGTYLYQNTPQWYSAPSAPAYYGSTNVESSRAFYPGSANADKVVLNVNVPADAKIMVQGTKTIQTGAVRHFVSPSLNSGYRYSYSVQATWMENGKEVSQSRSFGVQPGDVVQITFTRDGVQVRQAN